MKEKRGKEGERAEARRNRRERRGSKKDVRPAKNPTRTEVTDEKLTGSPKKIMPDAAIGSLLSAPTCSNFARNARSDLNRPEREEEQGKKRAKGREKHEPLSRWLRT